MYVVLNVAVGFLSGTEVRLSNLQFLVFDEADRLFEDSFAKVGCFDDASSNSLW